jgi:hypothetical protein
MIRQCNWQLYNIPETTDFRRKAFQSVITWKYPDLGFKLFCPERRMGKIKVARNVHSAGKERVYSNG